MLGIGALADGKRKDRLTDALDGVMELFAGRVLPFDIDAARHYADLAVNARVAGKGFPTPDGHIAAIAASKGFVVATRDASAFDVAKVEVGTPSAGDLSQAAPMGPGNLVEPAACSTPMARCALSTRSTKPLLPSSRDWR